VNDDDRKRKEQREKFRSMRQVGLLTSIPFLLLVSPLVGYWMGTHVDRWLHSSPWGADIGVALGLAAGLREVVRVIRRAGEEAEE
jgi:F0F1-type ATP synthase assembly protein I